MARMDELPEAEIIRAVHPADVGGTKEVFKCYLTEPKIYTSEKGHASGRARAISVFSSAAPSSTPWLAYMCGVLPETIANETARAELDLALSTLDGATRPV
ncbi:hypothetical protein [Bradyrhizobium valentinum]|nr:hypothetical protein [Bradyrhizobium valentinum]